MNLGQILLLNALLVGGGIFVYDAVIRDDTPAPGPAIVYESAETPSAPSDDPDADAGPMLAGANWQHLDARVRKLEDQNRALRALLAEKAPTSGVMLDDASSGGGSVMPTVELPDIIDSENPEFDDNTIKTLRAYMDEVERQRRQERLQEGLTRQLERLGVQLSDDQQSAVIAETLKYRDKSREMMRNSALRGGDEESREARRKAFEDLREEFSTTVYSLVPTGDAEKIVNGMGRGIGWGGGGFRAGDTGGAVQRRANRGR